MCLLSPGPHTRGENAEIGELPLPATRELLQAVVLDPEPGQQLLRVLLEPIDQSLDVGAMNRKNRSA